jgi:hypothetical protein
MKRPLIALAAIAAVAAIAPLAAQAQGQSDPAAKADFIGSIKAGKKKATLKVTYNCKAGQTLWVSAKQSASGKKDKNLPKEGSSKKASAWWQSHRNKFVCDEAETSHTGTFTIDKVEKGSKGTLKDGTAWVQFCVTQGDSDLVLSASGWLPVTAS